jgi:hypothetical protein
MPVVPAGVPKIAGGTADTGARPPGNDPPASWLQAIAKIPKQIPIRLIATLLPLQEKCARPGSTTSSPRRLRGSAFPSVAHFSDGESGVNQ